MNKDAIFDILGHLILYFVIVFVGEWIIAKMFAPVEAIPFLIAFDKYFKAFGLAFLAFLLYLIAAVVTAEGDDTGKFVVSMIFIFSVYSMYDDVSNATESTIRYMFFAIPETLRIIATFCALRGK